MTLALSDTAPDFEAQTTEGKIRFHDWVGNSWAVLFSHPKDFTPVCTTELGYMAKIKPEFDRRGVKIIGLSVDPIDRHAGWAADIEETQGYAPNYPMIGDTDFNVSKLYGMLPAAVSGDPLKRTPADNQTVRNVFVIGPDKKVKLILVYPMTTGRNFDEVLRVIDSLQMTAKHKVATPVNWKHGEDDIIAGSVSDEDARKAYPQGWKAPKPYIRIVAQPGCRRWPPHPGRLPWEPARALRGPGAANVQERSSSRLRAAARCPRFWAPAPPLPGRRL
jgi:alkyl hydroperoxide reductase subunit AhpC